MNQNEIKINRPHWDMPVEEENSRKLKPWVRKTLKFLMMIMILVVVVAVVYFGRDLFVKIFQNKKSENYSAVFLTNGQVYFGKIEENDNKEIVLNNVFYIQINDKTSAVNTTNVLGQSSFNLVKLGNELHGPTDELFITKSQVLFYENLRDDSKVVESIKNYKQ